MIRLRHKRFAFFLLVCCLAAGFAAALLVVWKTVFLTEALPVKMDCALPDDRQSKRPGMVWVPAGTFQLGDTVYPEEGPRIKVSVKGFWMDRTEVTNREFAAFVAATGYITVAERPVNSVAHPNLPPAMQQPGAMVFISPDTIDNTSDVRQWWQYLPGANWRHPGGPKTRLEGRDLFPVVAVTIADAQAYAHWKGHTLPTEAQWEWAARGGETPEPGSQEQPAQANTWQGTFPLKNDARDGFVGLAPSGCFKPNGYGLFDMIGNVWELTQDIYKPYHDARDNLPPDQERVATRPTVASPDSQMPPLPPMTMGMTSTMASGVTSTMTTPAQHVIKGGSFLCAPNYCIRYRSGAREGQEDDLATSHLGFRTIWQGRAP